MNNYTNKKSVNPKTTTIELITYQILNRYIYYLNQLKKKKDENERGEETKFVHKYSPLVTNLRRNKNGMDVCCFHVHRNQQRKRSKIKIPFSELIASNKIIRHFPPPRPLQNRLTPYQSFVSRNAGKAKQKDVTSETNKQ